MANPYGHGLAEDEHMIKNDGDQHNAGEKETELPRHGVAEKTCGELQKPRVGNETHCNENELWDDHTRSSLTVYVAHHRCGAVGVDSPIDRSNPRKLVLEVTVAKCAW